MNKRVWINTLIRTSIRLIIWTRRMLWTWERTSGQILSRVARFIVCHFNPLSHGAPVNIYLNKTQSMELQPIQFFHCCLRCYSLCRFCRHSWLSLPWGSEEGPIRQAGWHLGMWCVLYVGNSIFPRWFCSAGFNAVCVFRCDPLHSAGGLPPILGWGPTQTIPADQGRSLWCE